jgi:hypothetical protein
MRKASDQHLVNNRYAIITIMMKQIAVELRDKWPHLHIKAHPLPYAANRARLVVRKDEIRLIFDIKQGGTGVWNPMFQRNVDPNEYVISVAITNGNRVSRRKTPNAWSLLLDDPSSVHKCEEWIDSVVKQWIDFESE